MASIVTQNVSAAASVTAANDSIKTQLQGAGKNTPVNTQQTQIIQTSQVKAARSASARIDDDKRSPQVPKRVEGAFTPQLSYNVKGQKNQAEEKPDSKEQKEGLDVVA